MSPLTKRIIPCLDVTEGRVVKGTNFINLRDAGDPVELAKPYNSEGADELVFLDITASSDKRDILLHVVEKTAETVFIPLTVGGGVRDLATIQDILNAGADKVSINSAALKTPELVLSGSQKYGAQCIVVAIDARKVGPRDDTLKPATAWHSEIWIDEGSQWEVYSHGGRHRTGFDALKWACFMEKMGAGELLVTSMDKDGTKSGYDIPLTGGISSQVHIPVIASGGAGTCAHIAEALTMCEAALLASLLHFREVSIQDIKRACAQAGLPMRE